MKLKHLVDILQKGINPCNLGNFQLWRSIVCFISMVQRRLKILPIVYSNILSQKLKGLKLACCNPPILTGRAQLRGNVA